MKRIFLLLATVLISATAIAQDAKCTDVPAAFAPPNHHRQVLFGWTASGVLHVAKAEVPISLNFALSRADMERGTDDQGKPEYQLITIHEDLKGNQRRSTEYIKAYPETLQLTIDGLVINEATQEVTTVPFRRLVSSSDVPDPIPSVTLKLRFRFHWIGSVNTDWREIRGKDGYAAWSEDQSSGSHYLILDIPSKALPLDDELRFDVLDETGIQLACFTAHL